MIAIGLIEQLSRDTSAAVTYFFCQNANDEINTLESIVKGLILQLVRQQKQLVEPLQRRWDVEKGQFYENINSWRELWDIFLEMLTNCTCQKVYVIVDALDECRGDGMADFLKCLVRTGLQHPSKIKWLLTSRPLYSAEQELLSGSEQVLLSLELNSEHISKSVNTYITSKVGELDRRYYYGMGLRLEIEAELGAKAENTFLWVSLVCKELEGVDPSKIMTTIQNLPPGLHPLYKKALDQIKEGKSAIVKECLRLLKVMMLVYRPLDKAEASSVIDSSQQSSSLNEVIDRCASFFNMRGTNIEFVHQSARDYLDGENGQSTLNLYEDYGQGEIALSCLSYLTDHLEMNPAKLPRPDSTRPLELMQNNSLVVSLDYAVTFWTQHLESASAKQTILIQTVFIEQGKLERFLRTKFLEWLECLSLLNELPHATRALKILSNIVDVRIMHSIHMSII